MAYFFGMEPKKAFEEAEPAAVKAVELDKDLAEGHAVLSLLSSSMIGIGVRRTRSRAWPSNSRPAMHTSTGNKACTCGTQGVLKRRSLPIGKLNP